MSISTGKLTVNGLIDPTGIKMAEQAADPGATGAGEGTFWVRNDAPNIPMFTDDGATDWVLQTAPTDIGVKTVYVDPAGTPGTDCDFTTIALACAYLKSLPGEYGGIITLKGGVNHTVSTTVDATGIIFQNGYGGRPVILAATGGVLQVDGGGVFRGIKITVPAGFAGTYLLDVADNGQVDFIGCDFAPATGKAVIGSSGGPFVLTLTIRESGQSDQNGLLIDSGAVFTVANLIFTGTNFAGIIQCGVRNIIKNSTATVDTTGTITGIPDATIYVAPGENIQAVLHSLQDGGVVTLLPGTHDIISYLHSNNNVTLQGYGAGSIIRAQSATWLDSAGVTIDTFGGLAGDTLTITTSVGGPVVLTEGVDWTAGVSNDATATSLSNAINATSATHGLDSHVHDDSIVITALLPATTITTLTSSDVPNMPASPPALGDAVINIGCASGGEPNNGCIVRDLQIMVEPNIHGIKVNGGSDNKVLDCQVTSTALKSSARTGIVFTDSQGTANGDVGKKFTCSGNCVTSTASAVRWVDGIHLDGDDPFPGAIFGYGNRIKDSILIREYCRICQ